MIILLKLCVIIAGLACSLITEVNGVTTKYEPNWESLDSRPLPRWYDEAKVGIFLHWGVYSVPSFGSEWFWTNWINLKNPTYVEFMKKHYAPNFTYQEFAKDFTAELFNATQWALLFKDSGAKYVVLTSKHHDGYTLWPSTASFGWNSMDIGPKRDIIKEISSALRQNTSLKFGIYYSLFEWFNRMYINDKLHIFLTQNYVDRKMRPEQMELVQQYLPEVIWSDGDWEAPDKYWRAEEFIAWLYNDSPVRDTVVTNDRWGFGTACRHGDFYNCADRFNPGVLQTHKWENALTLEKYSWGQRFDVSLKDFMTPEELIKEVVSTVSCNGNVLINVGPTKYGTILPIFEERLRQLGHWLEINGEGIYATKPWIFQNDSVTPNVWYTTKSDPNSENLIHVYATVLEYPYDTNMLDIYPFKTKNNLIPAIVLIEDYSEFHSEKFDIVIDSVVLLGMEQTQLKWSFDNKKMHIEFPPKHHIDKRNLKYAWTFKITFHR